MPEKRAHYATAVIEGLSGIGVAYLAWWTASVAPDWSPFSGYRLPVLALFGAAAGAEVEPVLEPCAPHDPLDELSLERQAVGFYLSGHPFHEYREFMDALPVSDTRRAATLGEGAWVDLAGVVTSFTEARDRNKRLYARTHFEDRRGMIEVIAYADLYEKSASLIQGDGILIVGGRMRVNDDGTRIVIADRAVTVDEALRAWTHEVLLRLGVRVRPAFLGVAATAACSAATCVNTRVCVYIVGYPCAGTRRTPRAPAGRGRHSCRRSCRLPAANAR